ncbi:hypothetical protein LTS08_008601 [Lithohypha guttulata]|uniref:uncharacterized protein n=1 Tax=Lithohypha guttulata TaxID=1690604 RepID=UPI002DE0FCD2|nr:hypothetical protein LTS08_008601 [Lithohypha guttulata]
MCLNSELCVFDPAGDVVLIVETHQEIFPISFEVPVETTSIYNTLQNDVLANDDPAATANAIMHYSSVNVSSRQHEVVSSQSAKNTRTVRMKVPSKHLAFASPVFAGMISVRGQDESDDTWTEIPLAGDDIHALKILLNIIHGHHRKVPRKVERPMLWEALRLIDKYEFHEVTEVFTDIWYGELRQKLPTGPDNDLASWIYSCSELNQTADLENTTRNAILETDCSFPSRQEAQLPYWILETMQARRRSVLSKILSTLSKLVEMYEGPRRMCHQVVDCDALALGKLIRGLKSARLYPIPELATLTTSPKDLMKSIRDIELAPLCNSSRKKGYKHSGFLQDDDERLSVLHLDQELRDLLIRTEAQVQGLELHKTSGPTLDGA